ncbi:MAG: hypothetical protein HUU60_08990 [Armatimonadetes bacterium]|nr:hypothetical protein [Armatimonadota bacterium]
MNRLLIAVALCFGAAFAQELPVTKVALYRSGVGYIERLGYVQDRTSVTLHFRAEQFDDILKSLVLQDLDGGRALPVSFGSKSPIEKTLESFAINLADNPSREMLLNRLRGAEIEFSALGKTVIGRVVGVHSKNVPSPDGRTVVQKHEITLSTTSGFQTLPLDGESAFSITDPTLRSELAAALVALAAGLDAQRRPVNIAFEGVGRRRARIAYVVEMPVWKMSYRLALDPDGKALVQGWAIVENSSDEDWKGVSVSLIAGRPQSFIADLYQSIYVPRPRVQTSIFATPEPTVLRGGVTGGGAPAPGAATAERRAGRAEMLDAAKAPPADFGFKMEAGVEAMAEGEDLGAIFEYRIDQPLSLDRRQSAMLPVVNQPAPIARFTVVEPGRTRPMFAVQLTNDTGLTLLEGPVTVFDRGTYSGDGLIDTVGAGEKRLIAYAFDLELDARIEGGDETETITSVKIVNGVLEETRRARNTANYALHNRSAKEKSIVLTVPKMDGYEMAMEQKPMEDTIAAHRFLIQSKAQSQQKFSVVRERTLSEMIAIDDQQLDRIALYLKDARLSQGVRQALTNIQQRLNTIRSLEEQKRAQEARRRTIEQDQSRIRENMARLNQQSALYNEYVTRLTAQEKELDEIRSKTEKLQEEIDSARVQLRDFISNLNTS